MQHHINAKPHKMEWPEIHNMPSCPQCKKNDKVKKLVHGQYIPWDSSKDKYYADGGMDWQFSHKCFACNKGFKVN